MLIRRPLTLLLVLPLVGLLAPPLSTARGQETAEPPVEPEAQPEAQIEADAAAAVETPAAEPPASEDEDASSPEAAPEETTEPAAEPPKPSGFMEGFDSDPDNPGQATLDRAMDQKLSAQSLKDLNEVVDQLDEAIEEGLDADNTDFAEQVLAATLMQRAEALASIVLRQPMPNPQVDPRGLQWLQVRGRAVTDLLRVVSLEEDAFEAWLLIGRLQSLPRGDKSEARRALTSAIKLAEAAADDPDAEVIEPSTIAQAYALRGASQKEDEGRLADFTKSIELQPEKAEYLMLRAQAHRAAGRADECLADIDAAIALAPENPKVYELKALALSMLKRSEEAIEAFDKASELAPKLLTPYQYRSELYSQLGKLDEAIAQLDKALEVSPNNLASLLIRAQLLTADGQHDRALEDIDAILKQRPMLPAALLMKARSLDKLDRTDEAVALLEKLISTNPDRTDLQMQLASFYTDKQMADEAIVALTRVIELEEDNGLAWRLRGDMHLFSGKHDKAIADFEKALELDPADSGVLNNYAWTLATSPYPNIRDGEKAVELASRACELTQHELPHILSTLAAAHAEAGEFEEAVKRSEEAVAKAEENGSLAGYDGQLQAELNCYKSGQPWRELQKLSVAGPADETADQLQDLDSLEIDQPEDPIIDAPPAVKPLQEIEEAPPRSFDF